MSTSAISIEQLAINTIRTLSMDAVQAANSGHPGTPMALAPVAYTIWNRVMHYDPQAPLWLNRDRFVLSCGHASMLLYSMLHLCDVQEMDSSGQPTGQPAVSLEEIKNFRQLDSKTPGHPEVHLTTGVETTTGPLGQGCGNSVGMAIASEWLAARFNRPGFDLFNFDVYALCSDGDLMEGVASEAASLAGHLKLSNLCWIYDNNHITIEGDTALAYSEQAATRFEGYGWNTIHVRDANDVESLTTAFQTFKDTNDRPTLIVVDSHIAWGAPNKQDTHGAHGAPLGEEEVKLTKHAYGWPEDKAFFVPDGVREHFEAGIGRRGQELRQNWEKAFAGYREQYPDLAEQLDLMQQCKLPQGWDQGFPEFPADAKGAATRATSGKVLQAVGQNVPWLIGGSADLAPSTKTLLEFDGAGTFSAEDRSGRNFHFGIREHGMQAAINGLTLCNIRGYGSTFLVFSDYCRPSLRLAALSHIPTITIFTHDSIGVGEDGPTHQPIEHVAALRAIPNMIVMRPGDANEVAEAWKAIMPLKDRPVSLILTRQNVPTLDRTKYASAEGVRRGAYVVADAEGGKPQVLLLTSGSELSLCVEAFEQLKSDGVAARVVSMPSWELFEDQDESYRKQVLPPDVKSRVVVEMATSFGWAKWAGDGGVYLTMDGFGASAPHADVTKRFGFTVENVVAKAKQAVRG